MPRKQYLVVTDHSRDTSQFKYVYPVVSRRAGGLSIGINLNPNSACNWRCIYCEIPNLTRGNAPKIEVELLAEELRAFLQQVVHGDFMQQSLAEEYRQLKDIAFSGNGEPTSAKEFPEIINVVRTILGEFDLLHRITVRLITNGSLIDKPAVQAGLKALASINGEVWFKLDAATQAGFQRINDVTIQPERHLQRLMQCATLCPTYVQTCMMAVDGIPPSEAEMDAYAALITPAARLIKGVHLYGIARPSMQLEAPRLSRLPEECLNQLADKLRALGITVQVSV